MISVDGHMVPVTTNLEAALRELRSQTAVTLWVDALCINQDDPVKRALQVMRMGIIYAKAMGVVVWLGVKNDKSALVFNRFRTRAE